MLAFEILNGVAKASSKEVPKDVIHSPLGLLHSPIAEALTPYPRSQNAVNGRALQGQLLHHKSALLQTTMPALNACLKVANIAEASGVPYVQNVAKVAVTVFELLEQKGNNSNDVKELCESIANTIAVIDTVVLMHGEPGASHFKDTCIDMEEYLESMAQELKDIKHKHHGIKGVFNVDKFRNTIQTYRRRVDDLKTDFIIILPLSDYSCRI